jgi:DNA-binding transcriptional ArsR family regulator
MLHALELGVEDLADTRFAISPLAETVYSLWALHDPKPHAIHRPWLRFAHCRLRALDPDGVLPALIGMRALPDFLTPRPTSFAPTFGTELAVVRATAPAIVRRDVLATFTPDPPPGVLCDAVAADDRRVLALLGTVCDLLERYWQHALAPVWPRMRLVLEADTSYRARRFATGGARELFADIHPNLRWHDGMLHVSGLIRGVHTKVGGRGLLLLPSLFVPKPTPPVIPDEPWLAYPSRGTATLWSAPAASSEQPALARLLGQPRARLLALLEEPLPTIELARRLDVTPSAVSQHLQVLHASGLLSRHRDGRRVIYRRTALGAELSDH